jgi:hypothetical protein
MPDYTVNWSFNPKNCNVMSKLLKKCSENNKKCVVYNITVFWIERPVYSIVWHFLFFIYTAIYNLFFYLLILNNFLYRFVFNFNSFFNLQES